MRMLRAQSATEYLLTYSWAFLIAAVVIAALYFFVFAPAGITPTTCTFSSGPHCQDIVLGSSASLSKMALLLTNTNPFPIISPKITANITGFAPIQGTCVPYFILPGGAVICNATITPAIAQSSLSAGRFIFSYIPCPGGNVTICASNSRQSFPGSFNIHSSPLLSPTTTNVILTAQNSSQIALSSVKDKLTANVKLLGTPLSGATVNFTTTGSAVISPSSSSTDGSGNAVTYIYDTVAENVLVSASFANATSNTIIHFLPAVCFTVSLGSASPSANALTIDGVGHSSFPVNLCYAQGSSHSYSFASTVAGSAGIQYAFSSASGCGASGQSGTIVATTNCTLTGTYTTQYLLTTSSSPGSGGTATPSSQYYNSGTQVTLGETPSGGYFFLSWTGSGTGSYSGNTAAPTIGMNGVITQQANFYSTSTTTTTSTSTTSTTTTSIVYNPTSGTYLGDIVYNSGTTLTGNVVASNMILINSGISINQCSHYLEGNVLLQNSGTITDSCSSGASGSAGGAGFWSAPGPPYADCGPNVKLNSPGSGGSGGAGSSRISRYLGITLTGGAGGNGGAGGAAGGCEAGMYLGSNGGSGGAGGAGGGTVEIYSGNIINLGIISVAGSSGNSGSNGPHRNCNGSNPYDGGDGGTGGNAGGGGKVLLGYITSITLGTVNVASGSGGGAGGGGNGCGGGLSGNSGGSGSSGSSGQVVQSLWSN